MPTRDIYDYWTLGANLLLAAIGLAGVVAAFLNIRVARDSASAAKAAAEAALLTVRTNVNAERPWLVVEASGIQAITFKMSNRGRTPAQLVWYNNFPSHRAPLLGEDLGQPSYGAPYEDPAIRILNVPMIFPDGDMEAGSFSLRSIQQGNPRLWEEIRTLQRELYVYSAIKYKGPFSDEVYETRYCFQITPDGPLMHGDNGYNFHR